MSINSKELLSINTNDTNKTVVSLILDSEDNATSVDFRQYWDSNGTGNYIPTKRGVRVPIDNVSDLIEALSHIK